MNNRLEEITDVLTPKAIKELKVGQTLTFVKDGIEQHYKIKRKRFNRIWVKKCHLYRPEEVIVQDVHGGAKRVIDAKEGDVITPLTEKS